MIDSNEEDVQEGELALRVAHVKAMTKPTSGGGRPKGYFAKDGKKVPGVTTLLGKFKEPGALMYWAWQQGQEGKDFRDTKDDAANAGHVAHQWIDDDIHGRPLKTFPDVDPDTLALAEGGYGAYCKWKRGVNLVILDTERPLVSELHRFGGTYDALGLIEGSEVILLDWKSGNRVYTEHVAQLAAYRQLVRENGKRDVSAARMLRVGKESGTFADFYFPGAVLDAGWERFLASKWLCETEAALKKASGL